MIGKVYITAVNFYDVKSNTVRRKTRPVLVVGGPNENDYTVLPISSISNRANLNAYYDILVPTHDQSILNLRRECFIRTHKQMPVHAAELIHEIGNMKRDCHDLYADVLSKMDEFQKEIISFSL